MTVKINVKPKPRYQGFKQLDGAVYLMTFWWNVYTAKWYMSMKGVANDVDIKGKPLLCGKDWLKPHGYHELGELWVIDNGGVNEDPNYDDFGSRWTLEYTPKTVVTPAAAVVRLLTEVPVWVQVSPYDATSIAAILAYGNTLSMGDDATQSALDTYVDAAYGSNCVVNIGIEDNWGDQTLSTTSVEAHELPTFAAARIQVVPS